MNRLFPTGVLSVMVFALALSATTTEAATFQYSGTVEQCPETGFDPCGTILFVGDTISGPINVADGAALPDSSFSYTDVESFNIAVGNIFAVTSDNSMMVAGDVTLNSAGEVSGGYLAILAQAINAPDTLVTLDFSTSTWIAQALIPNMPVPVFVASGFGDMTVVPVPAGLVLLVPALGLLGGFRRKTG